MCLLQINNNIILHSSLAGPTLVGADVVSVAGGICGSCQFTNDSTAKGCTIKLYMNDNHAFHFNIISRQTPTDTLLLKCFEVPTPGLFHVEVHEASHVELKDNIILKLPDVEILSNGMSVMGILQFATSSAYTEATATAQDNTSAVIGLSVVLGITIFSVILAVCVLLIPHVKGKLHKPTIHPQKKVCAGSAVC